MLRQLLEQRVSCAAIAIVTSLSLAGCSTLPASGPSARAIEEGAVTGAKGPDQPSLQYALVELTGPMLKFLDDPGPGSFHASFGQGRGPAPQIKVGVGDTIQVTIFEAAAGGLFIPNDAGSRAGNFVTIPAQTVDDNGYITVPYAGQIFAKGRSLPQIEGEIVDKLRNRAIEPQAVVALTNQTSSQVTVIGSVGNPQKIAINPAGDRVLDVLSKAGGIVNPGYETFVTLQRGGRKATVYFLNLVQNANENIFLRPSDILYAYQEQRAFTAFGASGSSGQFKFQQERLALSDAVGKAGGLLDDRADPGQVLVYRLESRRALERMGVDLTPFDPRQTMIPTVFKANFRIADSFFVAQRFPMRDKDVIYVTNADQVELFKFLNLVTGVSNAVSSVAGDAVITRNAVRTLRR